MKLSKFYIRLMLVALGIGLVTASFGKKQFDVFPLALLISGVILIIIAGFSWYRDYFIKK